MNLNTDLIIIGGGAAGLMAAATASSEYGVSCVVIEKNNRPGRKLLMCGNNRCNLSTDLPPEKLLARYSDHNSAFLRHAIHSFTPDDLKTWFNGNGLKVAVKENNRIYPKSERSNDVVNCFKDLLREYEVPLILNSPVQSISKTDGGYIVRTRNLSLESPNVLIATGGVTYPKTGSVGDGQRFAANLDHKVLPYRPGMAAFELQKCWWSSLRKFELTDVVLSVHANGKALFSTRGGLEIKDNLAHGVAVYDASTLISRNGLQDYTLSVDMLPQVTSDEIQDCESNGRLDALLSKHLSKENCKVIAAQYLGKRAGKTGAATLLKAAELPVKGIRPLKEAMVTVGGVSVEDIDSETMMSTKHPGLYFAGEVMDIEGPCGGFNLHAAFATARLAVKHVASQSASGECKLMSAHNSSRKAKQKSTKPYWKKQKSKNRRSR